MHLQSGSRAPSVVMNHAPAGNTSLPGRHCNTPPTNGSSTGVTACNRSVYILAVLLMGSVACCAHLKPPPYPGVDRCPGHHVLLDALLVPQPPVVKGIAKIKVESPEETFSVKELIIAQAPDRLRLETLSPLGQPGFYAATDGQDLFLFAPSENTYYRGAATPRNLGLIIPLRLGVEDMVSVIRGRVPLIAYDADHLRCAVEEAGYVLQLKGRDENTTQVLTFSRDGMRVVTSETYGREGLTCSIRYADYEPAGSIVFPRTITVSLPSEGTTVRIHYKTVELPPEIDSSFFRLSVPQGAKIVPLE